MHFPCVCSILPPLLLSFLLILSRLALAQCPGTSAVWLCSPVGRQTTQYRLGADRDRVVDAPLGVGKGVKKKRKKKKEGDGGSEAEG